MMKRSLSIVAIIVCTGTTAFAKTGRTLMSHASDCQPTSGVVERSQFGVDNPSSSTATVVSCPIPVTGILGSLLSAIPTSNGSNCMFTASARPGVVVYDRNLTQDVSCTLYVLSGLGNVFSSYTVASSGVNSAAQILAFPATTFEGITGAHVWISCTIPPADTAGLSHVVGFSLNICE
jgi:hypothetical protein